MEFTQERADAFVGGELEIRSTGGGCSWRGPIIAIELKNNKLYVKLEYLASREGGTLNPKDIWTKSVNSYDGIIDLSLEAEDKIGGISFLSASGEVTTFIPPSGNKLDPARIRGL